MGTYSQNAPAQRAVNRLGLLMWELSNRDIVVLKTTTAGEQASVQIDRPFDCAEPKLTQHGDKFFGSTEFQNCRVYWEVQP